MTPVVVDGWPGPVAGGAIAAAFLMALVSLPAARARFFGARVALLVGAQLALLALSVALLRTLLVRGGLGWLDIGGWQGAVIPAIDPLGLIPMQVRPAGAAVAVAVSAATLVATLSAWRTLVALRSTAPAAWALAACACVWVLASADAFGAMSAAFAGASLCGSAAFASLAPTRDAVRGAARVALLHRAGDAALCFAVFVVGTELGGLDPASLSTTAPALEPWTRLDSGLFAGFAPRELWQLAAGLVGLAAATRLLMVPLFLAARDTVHDAGGVVGLVHGVCGLACGGILLSRCSALLSLAPEVAGALGALAVATLLSCALWALIGRDVRRIDLLLLTAAQAVPTILLCAADPAPALLAQLVVLLACVPLCASGAHVVVTTRIADPRLLGALESRTPRTHTARLLATGALAGPIFSGAFALVHTTASAWLAPWLGFGVALGCLIGFFLLALAAFRPLHLIFTGKVCRTDGLTPIDPPALAGLPPLALGLVALPLGLVLIPRGVLLLLPFDFTMSPPLAGLVAQDIAAEAAVRAVLLPSLVGPPLTPSQVAALTLVMGLLGYAASALLFRGGPRAWLTAFAARPWPARALLFLDGMAGAGGSHAPDVGEGAVRLSRLIASNLAPAFLETVLRRVPSLASALASAAVRIFSSGSAQRGTLFAISALALLLWWWNSAGGSG